MQRTVNSDTVLWRPGEARCDLRGKNSTYTGVLTSVNTSVTNCEGGCYLGIIKTDIRDTRSRL